MKKAGIFPYSYLEACLRSEAEATHWAIYLKNLYLKEGVNRNLVYLGNAEKNLIEPCKTLWRWNILCCTGTSNSFVILDQNGYIYPKPLYKWGVWWGVNVHQGSVLGLLWILYAIMQEALFRLCMGAAVCRWPDDHCRVTVGTAVDLEGWRREACMWTWERQRLWCLATNLDLQKKSRKDHWGMGRNAIFCGSCLLWVNKKCSGILLGTTSLRPWV